MVFLWVPVFASAQPASQSPAHPGTSRQQLSLLLHKPLGVFDRSHSAGFGAEYAYSPGRFGMDVSPAHEIGWIARGGIDLFIGRSHPTEGYAFRYNNYFYAQAMGGLIWNPLPFANLSLTAGPGLGLYGGAVSPGINAMVSANVFVDQRISIGPSAGFRKHREADGLWTAGVKIGYTL
ncbi:MAG: hypothetical protein EOO09_10690 [Chitinophagaceae bacterium]|nr:MAG: hypothetical protein EOO09_10690 [Chitinophagaceae bacterium]